MQEMVWLEAERSLHLRPEKTKCVTKSSSGVRRMRLTTAVWICWVSREVLLFHPNVLAYNKRAWTPIRARSACVSFVSVGDRRYLLYFEVE